MTTKLYYYNGDEVPVTIPCEVSDLLVIHVEVISGDERVTFITKNGKTYTRDAGYDRRMDFLDGGYDVKGDDIQAWLDYDGGSAYSRQSKFSGWDDDNEWNEDEDEPEETWDDLMGY